jgi:hypothetical protein
MGMAYLILNICAMPFPGPPFLGAPYYYGDRGPIIAHRSGRAELVS